MEQLHIVDYYEWWVTFEDGYGNHGVWAKYSDEDLAREWLAKFRQHANTGRKERFECQRVHIHHTAEKLDW